MCIGRVWLSSHGAASRAVEHPRGGRDQEAAERETGRFGRGEGDRAADRDQHERETERHESAKRRPDRVTHGPSDDPTQPFVLEFEAPPSVALRSESGAVCHRCERNKKRSDGVRSVVRPLSWSPRPPGAGRRSPRD